MWDFAEINRRINFAQINRRINKVSLRALEDAYQGAIAIKEIEDTHFGGKVITPDLIKGKTVGDYFRSQLDRQLLRIRSSLLRFRVTGFLVNRQMLGRPTDTLDVTVEGSSSRKAIASEVEVLEKLAFIESVVGKYRVLEDLFSVPPSPADSEPAVTPEVVQLDSRDVTAEASKQLSDTSKDTSVLGKVDPATVVPAKAKSVKANKTPTSARLFGGVLQIRKEFSPKYEREVVQELRVRRIQNRAAIRWLAVLLIVPILVQVVTKNLLLNPILGSYSDRNPSKIELSRGIEEEFLHKFSEYKEALEVKALLVKSIAEEEHKKQEQLHKEKPEEKEGEAKSEEALAKAVYGEYPVELTLDTLSLQPGRYKGLLTAAQTAPEVESALEEKALEEKALELWREARNEQLDGLKNVLADGFGLGAFVALIYFGRQRLVNLRNFSNRAFLNFNDPTKVFLFILITDMFVGFHSAEGWEVILEGILHHFGLPESKVFINGFIATVPVMIDACIKFWIFSYLTRYSPSTSAIYERMNT